MGDKRPDQVVPLVIYKSGERITIGSAYLMGDGRIEAQIAKDVKKEISDLIFGGRVADISLNPKVSVSPDLKYNRISTINVQES